MNKFKIYFSLIIVAGFLISCTVTNNLYVNNPVPSGKANGELYLGIGTGIEAKIDSVSTDGTINFSNKTSTAPILSIGVQLGVLKQMDIRAAVHLPYIIGGIGFRLGTQYSFFDAVSRFNAALGIDLGFTAAKDSLKIFGSSSSLNTKTKGAFNADVFLPVSVKLADHFSIVLTPRYSYNAIYVRKNENYLKGKRFDLYYPALSLGIRISGFYLETTALYYDNSFYPHIGVVWLFSI